MGISHEAEVEAPYRLFTAAGFSAEKSGVDALLSHALDAAYGSNSMTNIRLNDRRQAVVESTTDGKKDKPLTVDFNSGQQFIGLSMGMEYNVVASTAVQKQEGHVILSKPLIGSGYKFNIEADGKAIEGRCQVSANAITCNQTIKDVFGNLILTAVSQSDMVKNINDFHQSTQYTDAKGKPAGSSFAHYLYDDKANTLHVESSIHK